MAKGYIALCALLLQAAWIQAAPADGSELARPRRPLGVIDEHVVGGEYVDIEEVPYQLSLNVLWMHTCGAAIVSENFALTAAHCNSFNFLTKFVTWVTAGSTTMFPLNFGGSKHWLESASSHPQFGMSGVSYDVAVLKVRSPFQFNKRVKSLPLPPAGMTEEQLDYNTNAIISGWGATSEGNIGTVWLKKNSVRLVPRDVCKKAYSDQDITSTMICAGGFAKGDTCQGDSGGPLAWNGYLLGLVSWGTGCNRANYAGVYTNLLDPEVRQFVKEKSNL